MFENLSDKLGSVFDKLRGKGKLGEEDVDAAMREIRIALLEADVALPVAKDFIENIREKAVGQEVIKGVNPGQQVVKIVHDEMVAMLGGEGNEQELNIEHSPPVPILMLGLQGSGKTTSTAKIGKYLTEKKGKKVLMASLDTQRPAAQDQLKVLGEQAEIPTLQIIKGQDPQAIAKRAMETARKEGYDIVLLDTAGRLAIDEALMDEVETIRDVTKPFETLLVTDAMTGQDAVNTAKTFDEKIGLSGIMLTRVDGDARGGAAMSMRAVTGKPIKLLGTGEKLNALEPFHPERIAGRILGMGDVVSLVEKATETIDKQEAEEMAAKFQKGQFDLNDYLGQIRSMKKMGGMGSLLKMLPGLGKLAGKIAENDIGESVLKYHEAIIQSMTRKEKAKPALLNASRKKRVASGSGTTVQEVNKLLKQHQQMQTMMKKMRKQGMGGMMKQMQAMIGDENMEKIADMQDSPESSGKDSSGSSLPGLGSQGPMGGLPGLGGPAGMPGLPEAGPSKRGVTKKIKSRRKKGKKNKKNK
mgnify:CR=1 FL=1